MRFHTLSSKEFLNLSNQEYADSKSQNLESFKAKVEQYRGSLEAHKNQNEKGIVSNALMPFLQGLGFQAQAAYKHQANSEIDCVLLKDSQVEVIIEAKKLENNKEMFSPNNPNCKALHECILYYLREREGENSSLMRNASVRYIIITDFYHFYIFGAGEFKRCFYQNKQILKAYQELKNTKKTKNGNIDNQAEFYNEISKILNAEFGGDLEGDIFNTALQGAFFDLRNDKHLGFAHRILNRDFLHNEFARDSNALNPKFYFELLHILGLKETNEKGKILIQLDPSQNTSFAKHIHDKIHEKSPQSSESELFEATMSHIIIYLNRILFLKLIEANLLHFNDFDKNLRFLSADKILSFKTLRHLFFEVLAKDYEHRESDKGFDFLPYLNSSLFMRDEKEILDLSTFDDDLQILPFSTTQTEYKKDQKVAFLAYLFDFLECWDFGKSEDSASSDKLISSSVLGAMFEKLNGYKEGSFYTPNFITSFMCRKSLSKIVLEKFNAQNPKWNAKTLEDITDEIQNEKRNCDDRSAVESKYIKLLESIRICDPSVGSGHFLVSVLNEMVYIYYKLGFFKTDYALEIKDDEVYLKNGEENFTYKRPISQNAESHKLQITLFNLKKSIIENNLFGVDINPNSCNIARLRLWIELLKSAYYLEDGFKGKIHKLQTLPNIDINIKCGNSLISYFNIYTSLAHYPNINERMQNYKKVVQNYKERFYADKTQIDKQIKDLLQTFKNFCFKDKFKKEIERFDARCEEYSKKYGNYLAKDDKDLSIYVPQRMFVDDFDKQEAQKDFDILKQEYESIFNLESNKPFEWRFAFPEVLDFNGDFLGFDLVIGNPPYIRQEEIKHLKPHLQKAFKIYKGTSDIYTYFFELGTKILKNNGILSFITSNKWCRAAYGEPLREFLLENTTIKTYVDLNGIKVFESATVDTSILEFIKGKAPKAHTIEYANPKDYNPKEDKPLEPQYFTIPQDSLKTESFIFSDSKLTALKAKIENIGTPLKDWDININYGIKTGYNEAFIIDTNKREEILSCCKDKDERARTSEIIKPILRGRDIKRYSYEWAGLWIIFISWHFPNTDNPKSMQENEQDLAEQYPSLYFHLLQHKDRLSQRNKDETGIRYEWYCLQRWGANYYQEFSKPKIIYSEIVREPQFYLDNGEFKFGHFYAEATSFILSGNENFKDSLEYLLGILHSKLATFVFKEFYAGGGLGESGYRYKKVFLEKLPIPKITQSNQSIADSIIALVDEILAIKAKDSTTNPSDSESEINSLVYQLYNLTDDEIKIIEDK